MAKMRSQLPQHTVTVQDPDILAELNSIDQLIESLEVELSHRVSTLAELGAMSRLLAHETNGLLSQISAQAQLALMYPEQPNLTHSALELAVLASQRISSLTSIFLSDTSIAEHENAQRESFSLIHYEATRFLKNEDTARFGFELIVKSSNYVPDLLPVLLKQVLHNLYTNAIRASRSARAQQPGKSPKIYTLVQLEDSCGKSSTWNTPLLCITVYDQGIGMSRNEIDRVFQGISIREKSDTEEPQPYGEHGLGLKVCQRLLKEAGGTLECQSTPGEGTSMIIRVPAAQAKTAIDSNQHDDQSNGNSPSKAA